MDKISTQTEPFIPARRWKLRRCTIHLRRLFFLGNLEEFDAKKKFFQKFTGAQIPMYYIIIIQFSYFEDPLHFNEPGECSQYSD
jgi:hypothetical protein